MTTNKSTKKMSYTAEELKLSGGLARNEKQYVEAFLNKIRFLHQENSAEGSSIQTFAVQSYEVRDKIPTSSMNKLLHLYTTRIR